ERQVTGLVILTGPPTGDAEDHVPLHARDCAQHLVRITRDVPKIPGRLPRLIVVTRNAQAVLPGDVVNLEQGALRGLVRVIGAEHPHLHTTQIDADNAVDAEQLSLQLLSGSEEDETAWRNGAWYTARLLPAPLRPEERHATIVDHERDGMRLQIRTPGDLETLELVAYERVTPGPGQIEVAVGTSSVNFADVLAAMGMLPTADADLPELGMDFAGVVTAVGPDITDHRVGDRVGGFSAGGCWGTFVTCDARLAVTLPAEVTDHQAVAVATAGVTAWHSLHDQAGIASGDRVLIHSATGGVGQAAIAIARAEGAEIFATAGSEERRDMLRSMGIKHVYDSRSTEFAEQIRRDTDGYGVDIVLNSLTGPAQRAGLEL
ncbi:polyketide synthase, partial [Mycobacterium sp. ITM-2017-0098]